MASTGTILECVGSIERKSRFRVSRAISPRAPASSAPVGPAPTTTNVIHSARRTRAAPLPRPRERYGDPPRYLGGILDRLEPGGVLRPGVVAEVGETGPGRDDERVVAD